jgi:hypothetical protein
MRHAGLCREVDVIGQAIGTGTQPGDIFGIKIT